MTDPAHIITELINYGELDDTATTTQELLDSAGCALDSQNAHEICGSVLFRAADGKWYSGTTEFVIEAANPQYVVDMIYGDSEHLECLVCGHIKSEDTADFVAGPDNPAACEKCSGAMATITEERARQIAGLTK